MGHTQFIPTTYLAYAIDHDGDGRRDIWKNLGDVFASTANYLSVSGYRHNEAWGVEVTLPDDFDYALADGSIRKPLVEWAALGAASTTSQSLLSRFDPNLRGKLILPAGARGPTFIAFPNFDAIMKYNRSTAYALAVSFLSIAATGQEPSVDTVWPRDDRPLGLEERKSPPTSPGRPGIQPRPNRRDYWRWHQKGAPRLAKSHGASR